MLAKLEHSALLSNLCHVGFRPVNRLACEWELGLVAVLRPARGDPRLDVGVLREADRARTTPRGFAGRGYRGMGTKFTKT